MLKRTILLITSCVLSITFVLTSCTDLSSDSAEQCLKYFNNADYSNAAKACQQAANDGDAASQSLLGELYDSGQGVETNPDLARKWWETAAAQDYLPSQNLLALKYYYGGDVFGSQPDWPQDYRKAYELWKQSAYRGVATSQFMLGTLYVDGLGVERNYAEAYAWLNLSSQGGYKLATDALVELSRLITPEQKQAGISRINELQTEIIKQPG